MATRFMGLAIVAASLMALALSGCSAARSKRSGQSEADLNAPVAVSSAQVQRYRIRDWSAPNDHTVIMVSDDGVRYRAETLGPCQGLDFANRVGFVSRGGFNQIDRFSSVVLDDGRRCPFQSFDQLKTPESKALDSYEKAGESKPAQESSGKAEDSKPK